MNMNARDCSIFWAGLGVGAVLAMVFAPKAGSELRGDLMDKVKEGKRSLTDGIDNARSTINDQVSNVENAVKKGVSAFKEARQEATRSAG